MTTHYAAIDATDPISGALYGIGTTPEAALAQALEAGDPCVTHDADRPADHEPGDHFRVVPCTEAAATYVERHGGAPSVELTVTARDGVRLRSEEE